MKYFSFFVLALIIFSGNSWAQTATWNMSGTATATTIASTSNSITNVGVSVLTQGNPNSVTAMASTTNPSSGYTGSSGTTNAANSAKAPALNIASSTYYEFTLTPDLGYTVTLTALSFGIRSIAGTAATLNIRTSLNSYATDIVTSQTSTPGSWVLKSFTGISQTSLAGTTITFRIYISGGTQGTVRMDDLTVTASATAALPVPTVTLASASQIGSGIIGASTTKNVLSQFTAAVSASSQNATVTSLAITTASSASSSNISNLKLWYKSTNDLATASQIGSTITNPTGTSFSFTGLSQSITSGSTGYFWVTADVAASPTYGSTVQVNSIANSAFTISSGSVTGSVTAGGVQTLAGKPSLDTPTSADISNTTATLGASIVSSNNSTITENGIVFGTTSSPTGNPTPATTAQSGSFTTPVSSLTPQTLYYYRGYATNLFGTGYGSSDGTFYTFSNPPTGQASGMSASETAPATATVSWSTATFPLTGATTTGYVLLRATSPNTPSLGSINGQAPSAGTNTTIVSSSIAGASTSQASGGLAAGTTYNYLLVPFTWDGSHAATYNYYTAGAPTASITTSSQFAPGISTPTSASITSSTAVLGADVTSDGGAAISVTGVVYGTSSTPTGNATTTVSPVQSGTYTVNVSGLTPETYYYYRGYATNSVGTSYTVDGNFYSLSNVPSVQASGFSGTQSSTTAANLSWTAAEFPASGAATTGYVLLVATGVNTPSLGSANGQAPSAGTNTTIVSSSIAGSANSNPLTGLSAGTTYNYLLVPFTWDGVHAATYNYLTSGAPTATLVMYALPTLSTPASSSITTTSAGLGATIATGSAITSSGIVYGTSAAPTGNATLTDPLVTSGIFSVSISGLTSGTHYFYRGFAVNPAGTAYSSDGSFYTFSDVPSTHAGSFAAAQNSGAPTTAIDLSWTSATGATGYIILRKTGSAPTGVPSNGVGYSAGNTVGDATVAAVISSGATLSTTITGLASTTTHYFSIIPFNWDGTNAGTRNYKTDETIPTANQATAAATSATDYFRSVGTGNWATVGTWESSVDSVSWIVSTLAPTSSAKSISITSGHTVTVGATATASNLIIQSGGTLTLTSGLTVSHNSSNLYPYDLQISGTLTATGVLTLSSATASVLSGGLYQHNQNGGTIPTMTWAQGTSNAPTSDGSNITFTGGSTCELTGLTSATSIVGLGQTFWNFTVNSNFTAVNFVCGGQLNRVNGTLWIRNLGSAASQFRLVDRLSSATMTFGAIRCSNASASPVFYFINGGTAAAGFTDILNVGDIVLDGTASVFSLNNQTLSGTYTVNISGNLSIGAGTALQCPGSAGPTSINFNKSGLQKFSNSGTLTSTAALAYTVANGSILDLGSYIIPSTTGATFTLSSGATLKTGHAQGISTTTSTGAIQVPGTKSFNAGANYEYTGSSAQVTGNALPATINSLTINNAAGVSLTANGTISNTLTLTSGLLNLGNLNLTLAGTATVSGTPSASNMVVTNGTGQLRKTFSADGSFTFPVGDNTVTAEYSPMSVTLAGGSYSSAYVSAIVKNSQHASSTSTTDYITRYWTLASSGITGATYDVTGTYVPADVVGTESNMITAQYASAAWTNLSDVNSSLHTIGATGLTSLGDFTAITKPAAGGTVTITLIPEGYYRSDVDPLPVSDVFTATLASATGPDYADVETVNVTIDANTYTGTATFATAATGSYYLYVKGIALMATWSASPVSFVKGSNVDYDFTTGVDKAYAIPGFPFDPMILQGTKWTIYSGDVDQDELIGNVDLTMIDNDAFITLEVHGATDLDGDALVGNVDLTICDNHAFWVVESQTPRKVGGMASKYLHKPVLTRKISEQK